MAGWGRFEGGVADRGGGVRVRQLGGEEIEREGGLLLVLLSYSYLTRS